MTAFVPFIAGLVVSIAAAYFRIGLRKRAGDHRKRSNRMPRR